MMGRPKGSKNKPKTHSATKTSSAKTTSAKTTSAKTTSAKTTSAKTSKDEDIKLERKEKQTSTTSMKSSSECFIDAARKLSASGIRVDSVAPKTREFSVWTGKTYTYRSEHELEINGVKFWMNGNVFMCDNPEYNPKSKNAPYGYDIDAMAAAMRKYSRRKKPEKSSPEKPATKTTYSRLLNAIIGV